MTKVPESKLTLELFQYTLLWDGYYTKPLYRAFCLPFKIKKDSYESPLTKEKEAN